MVVEASDNQGKKGLKHDDDRGAEGGEGKGEERKEKVEGGKG